MEIPEGWKLVPVEPTKEMVIVLEDAYCDQLDARISDPNRKEWPSEDSQPLAGRLAYRAALAAAPTPPEQEQDEPVAYRWVESKLDCWRYDETPNPHRQCEPLYTHPDNSELRKAVAEYLAWYPEGYANVNINLKALRAALEGK